MSTQSLGLQYCDCGNYCGSIDKDKDNENNNTIIRSSPLDIVVRRPLVQSALSTKGFRGCHTCPHARAGHTHSIVCRRRRCRFARHRGVDVNINFNDDDV